VDAETTQSYDAAGFGASSAAGDALAVVVVDMCVAYFDGDSPLDIDQPAVVTGVAGLVDAARAADAPVLWTRVEFPDDSDSVWFNKVPALASFTTGNRLAAWIPGLEPAEGEHVVTKQHASGFFGTDLAAQLNARSIDTVIVCGVSTSGCVRATTTDASAHGFIPFVVREAVGDRTPAVHEASLFDLHAKYADVISLDAAKHLLDED